MVKILKKTGPSVTSSAASSAAASTAASAVGLKELDQHQQYSQTSIESWLATYNVIHLIRMMIARRR